MLPEKILAGIVKDIYGIKASELKTYLSKAKKLRKRLEQYLIDEGIIDELAVYKAAAEQLSVPFIELKGHEIKKDVLNLVPAPLAQTHRLIAFDKTKNEISLAMLDPNDIQTIEFIRRKTGLTPRVYLTTPTDIKDALRRYHADIESNLSITKLSDKKDVAEGDLKKAAEELPIINIVNSILEHAVFERASDIHIEPSEKEILVRYRVDGVLKPIMNLPKNVQTGIIARIKILANLKIDEHMIPQDGRFKILIQEEKYSFRVSIVPVYDGEKIVMRLLPEGQKPMNLDELGFLETPKKSVQTAIKKPHGMILVTGPTG
ncbi:MAG: hypothetical protein GF349_05080, partial [Candidatus Magasanikbacteria bacterium]|nr:hypothetical protein [Candidatus Magasanikbacteria bacterium]